MLYVDTPDGFDGGATLGDGDNMSVGDSASVASVEGLVESGMLHFTKTLVIDTSCYDFWRLYLCKCRFTYD